MADPIAVLTGDLIRSRSADPDTVNTAIRALEAAAADFGRAWSFDPRFTRFRGDGWQMLLPQPARVLDACLYMAARLRSAVPPLRTRISAGIGDASVPVRGDLSGATGPAFFVSGSALDDMPRKRRLSIAGDGVGIWQGAVTQMADWMIDRWTPPQAEAVALALVGDETNEEMAGRLGISRQAFEARLAGAGFAAFDEALRAFRTHTYAGGIT